MTDHRFGKKLFIRLTVRVFINVDQFLCVLFFLLILRVGYGISLYYS